MDLNDRAEHKVFREEVRALLDQNKHLAPGESSSWHHHSLDYITVGLTEGSRMRREFEDGTTDETNPSLGQWRFAEKHQPHVVTNIGGTRHRNILIELKK